MRLSKLAAHPLCEECGKAPPCDIDHIEPLAKAWNLRLEWTNLSALCKSCHSRKTAWEQTQPTLSTLRRTVLAKHAGGRPRTIASPEEFEERAFDYMQMCRFEHKPFTMCGLAFYLGFTNRVSKLEYGHRPEYSNVVKWVRGLVEWGLEERLYGPNSAGAMFGLSQQWHGWTNQRYDVRHSGVVESLVHNEYKIDWGKIDRDSLRTMLSSMAGPEGLTSQLIDVTPTK